MGSTRMARRDGGYAAATRWPKTKEIVFGHNEDAGELRVASHRGSALVHNATGVRERRVLWTKSDQAAEGMRGIPICCIVGIAEREIGCARSAGEREVDHPAGIARIKRAGDERLVGGEDRCVHANTECESKNRDGVNALLRDNMRTP